MNQSLSYWKKNLPLYLTCSRLFVVPLFFLFIHRGEERWPFSEWAVALVFVAASLTDWIDGWWARRYKVVTKAGALMDPVSDKILVLSLLLILLEMGRIPSEMLALILSRDILIGGVRSLAAAEGLILSARAFGKWKAALQMTAIPCLLIFESFPAFPLYWVGYCILWFSVILSFISVYEYTQSYFSHPSHKK